MIKKVSLLLFLVASCIGFAQKLNTTLTHSKPLLCDTYVGFDTLNDSYYIKDNVFIKKSGSKTWQYKNVALGKITSVDIINPLKIVLFYENFNTCILLDAQLNEILQKNFTTDLNNAIITAIGLASSNRLWLFNSLTNEILLSDYKTNETKTVGLPLTQNIAYYHSDFNSFFWIDDFNNCYSIDIFGKSTLLCTVPAYDIIQIIDNERILFSVTNKLYLLNSVKKSIIEIEIVENSFENFYYKDQNLAIFTNQQIKNYKIILP
jgi:hypothetical protein